MATLVKIIWVSNMWSQAAENHKKCGPGCNCSICVNASITNTTGDAHSRQVAMDNVEMDELRYSEHFALQDETCTMELIAEFEDLEDETDEEVECEVVNFQ